MECAEKKFTIRKLIDAWRDASLKTNSEYQRGASWSPQQMQGLIDSIFRRYPIPPIFLHRITSKGLEGETTRFEIVDGQQRIRALAAFFDDKFALLAPNDKKLRLPASLRSKPAPWAGRNWSQLDTAQKVALENQEIDVFVITSVEHPDEVRDLFIRLQSGTALSRQQIRDAWPGAIGPALEILAGKLDRLPTCKLFGLIDKRGMRTEDDRDEYVADRQYCAQLLTIFLACERDPLAAPSIVPAELDAMYHENTTLDLSGPTWTRFCDILNKTAKVVEVAKSAIEASRTTGRKKFRKLDVISLFHLVQDLTKSELFRLDSTAINKLANVLLMEDESLRYAKSTEGSELKKYYEAWRKLVPEDIGVRRDPQRLFEPGQKLEIFNRDQGKCAICFEPVPPNEDEYDHYPIPWRDGGRTHVSNGRLVCKSCHPRGGVPTE